MSGTKDNAYIHTALASCYAEANDNERAIAEYKEAIRISSDSMVGNDYLGLGQLYEKMGRYDDALATYLALTQLKPKEANGNAELAKEQTDFNQQIGYYSAGRIYVKKRLYREAVDAYSKAISIDPNELSTIEVRGDVYVALGEKDKAAADYIYVLENDGKPFKIGSGGTGQVGLDPEDRQRIKQKLQALGVAVPNVTPYPMSAAGMPSASPGGSDHYPTVTPVPPLPTATPSH